MYFDLNLVEEILCLIALAVLGNQLLKPRPAPTDFTTIILVAKGGGLIVAKY